MTVIKHVRRLVIHHSAGPRSQTTEQIRDYHVRVNKWADIGYHYVIEGDGSLHIGRPMPAMGAHARGINSESVGVCVVGDNTRDGQGWTPAQVATLRKVVDAYRRHFPEIDIVGHGQSPGQATACPGVSESVLRAMVGLDSAVQG